METSTNQMDAILRRSFMYIMECRRAKLHLDADCDIFLISANVTDSERRVILRKGK